MAEGFVNKLKQMKGLIDGRVSVEFFRRRVLLSAA
jgi:hypothetical protein